jgi:hypothetical protein
MSPRRRDSYAWWEYAIMAGVVVLIVGGIVVLARMILSGDEVDTPVAVPSVSVSAAPRLPECGPGDWLDQDAGACVPRAECTAPEVYEESTNSCAVPAPDVTEVNPRSGPQEGGTEITLLGIGFQPGATVTIDGALAADTVVVDSSTITARTPPSTASYPVDVRVANPDGQSDTLDNIYSYQPAQVSPLEQVVPASGSTAGGEAVVIKGRDFVDGAVVSFGGRPATEVQVLNATTIRALTPAGVEGAASVNVRNPGDAPATLSDGFTYVDRAPRSVSAVRPATGPAAGGTRITIRGSGFESGATVTIGGRPARQVDVVSSTRIIARTPTGRLGPANVAVRNPGVPAAILADAFTYIEAPTITSVSPRRGSTSGGTRVTITGTGFADDSIVTVGDVTVADARVVNATTIRLSMPPAAEPITVTITVTVPGQPTAVLRRAFTYRPGTEPEPTEEPSAEPTPVPTATRPTTLPRCPSLRVPTVSTSPGTGLVLTDADLFPTAQDLRSPGLVDAGIAQGDGSITWQDRPPRIEWQAPAGGSASATITYAYESPSCRGFGTGSIGVDAQ